MKTYLALIAAAVIVIGFSVAGFAQSTAAGTQTYALGGGTGIGGNDMNTYGQYSDQTGSEGHAYWANRMGSQFDNYASDEYGTDEYGTYDSSEMVPDDAYGSSQTYGSSQAGTGGVVTGSDLGGSVG